MRRAAFADGCEEGLLVFAHFVDERLIVRALVCRGPQHHFGENGAEVEPFGSEEVDELAAISAVRARGDNAVGFEAAKTIRKDVCGRPFVGVEEFLKGARAAQHHVSNYQQRPAIAEHFNRGVQGTPRTAFGGRVGFWHVDKLAVLTCNTQVSWGKLEIRSPKNEQPKGSPRYVI